MKKISRRLFTRGLASMPFTITTAHHLLAQSPGSLQADTPPPSAKRIPKTAAQYNRHPPVIEPEPFAGPIEFKRNEVRQRISPFKLSEVILDPGPLQQARDWNRDYMMRLSNDRLLHNFRLTAGIPSKAEPLGGWEAPKSELRGHFVGHYLSGAGLLIASTGDAQMKEKADGLVAGIAECQTKLNKDGYVSAFPDELFVRLDAREKVWAPFYTLHKIMAGLFDMYEYAGNQQALDVLLKLAAWVDAWTTQRSEEHMQDILKTEYGGMNDVLYNLSGATKDDRWARVGDRFTKKVFFTPLAMRQDQLKGLHANTHMPQVIGAARRYELSSDYRFGDIADFFWETIAESRTYASGGSGNTEGWLTQANRLALEMKVSSHHQECCCSYNMMKLARHLYGWSADTRLIDYYERNLWNHRIGAIEPKTGHTIYFLSMTPGAWKTTCTEDQTFWCCTGSALEDFAKLNDTIYYHDDSSVYLNLLVPSSLDWKDKGIRLHQSTTFPEGEDSIVTVQTTTAEEWTLHVRLPSWTTSEYAVSVNGQVVAASAAPGSYLAIHRHWKAGDKVKLHLPMQVTVEPLRDDPTLQAVLYGPIVLAGQFPLKELDFDLQHNQGPELQEAESVRVPDINTKGKTLAGLVRPVAGQPLTFKVEGQSEEVTLKPLNQSWNRFAVYWKVS
jgi:uncharacterized protein